MKKKLDIIIEYSSIFHDSRWTKSVNIYGFNSRKPKANLKILKNFKKIIDKYNKQPNERRK